MSETMVRLPDSPPLPSDIVRVSITFTLANGDESTISGAVRDAHLEITAPSTEYYRLGKHTVSLNAVFDPRPQWVVWGRSKAHRRVGKRTWCGRSWGSNLPRIAEGEDRCKACDP